LSSDCIYGFVFFFFGWSSFVFPLGESLIGLRVHDCTELSWHEMETKKDFVLDFSEE